MWQAPKRKAQEVQRAGAGAGAGAGADAQSARAGNAAKNCSEHFPRAAL